MEWTNANVLVLIDMYRSRPILWNSRMPGYKDKNKRHKALVELSTFFGVEKREIERKIKNLLSHFAREYKKQCSSGPNRWYKSRWFAFKSMLFLKDRYRKREIEDVQVKTEAHDEAEEGAHQDQEPLQTEDDKNVPLEIQKPILKTPQKKRFKTKPETHTSIPLLNKVLNMMKSIQSKTQDKDEYTVFGEQVAIKLRKLTSPHARFTAQSIINKTLFEAEMGKYDNPLREPDFELPMTSYSCPSETSDNPISSPLPSTKIQCEVDNSSDAFSVGSCTEHDMKLE